MTVDEVIQLSKLKTGDDLIIQIIQTSNLDRPTTPSDVIHLKQEGVSDRVIEVMLARNAGDQNVRSYTVTNKKGKTVNVFTNVDENGKRMGGPAPEPAPVFPIPEAPRETTVVVKREKSAAVYAQDYAPSPYSAYYGGGYGGYGGYYGHARPSYLPNMEAYLNFPHGNESFNDHPSRSTSTMRDSTFPPRYSPTPRPPMTSTAPTPSASFAGTRPGGFRSAN